jgi:CarD family transcriptional regulator
VKLTVGDLVVYPGQGPCRLDQIVAKLVNGQTISFYRLSVLDDSRAELFVPVNGAELVGLRLLIPMKEIPHVLNTMTGMMSFPASWKERNNDNVRLLKSGSAFDLAMLVKSLTQLRASKSLSFCEGKMLEKARNLLVREICEVTGQTGPQVEQEIDEALKSGRAIA